MVEYEEIIMMEDDGSYYEEEIIDDDDDDNDEYVEILVGTSHHKTGKKENLDEEDDETDFDYIDDDSTPPVSIDSDIPVYGGGYLSQDDFSTDTLNKSSDSLNMSLQLDLQNAAVSEGARKAMEEQVQREREIHRKKAKQALQRKRIQHEAELIRRQTAGDINNEEVRKQQEAFDSSRRRLAKEIRRVDKALSFTATKEFKNTTTKPKIKSSSLPPRPEEIAKKKKAIAALRRQAAREELARNNNRLKAAKASRTREFRSSTSNANRSVATANVPVLRSSSLHSTATTLSSLPTPSPRSSPKAIDLGRFHQSISVEVTRGPHNDDQISPLSNLHWTPNVIASKLRTAPSSSGAFLAPPPLSTEDENGTPKTSHSKSHHNVGGKNNATTTTTATMQASVVDTNLVANDGNGINEEDSASDIEEDSDVVTSSSEEGLSSSSSSPSDDSSSIMADENDAATSKKPNEITKTEFALQANPTISGDEINDLTLIESNGTTKKTNDVSLFQTANPNRNTVSENEMTKIIPSDKESIEPPASIPSPLKHENIEATNISSSEVVVKTDHDDNGSDALASHSAEEDLPVTHHNISNEEINTTKNDYNNGVSPSVLSECPSGGSSCTDDIIGSTPSRSLEPKSQAEVIEQQTSPEVKESCVTYEDKVPPMVSPSDDPKGKTNCTVTPHTKITIPKESVKSVLPILTSSVGERDTTISEAHTQSSPKGTKPLSPSTEAATISAELSTQRSKLNEPSSSSEISTNTRIVSSVVSPTLNASPKKAATTHVTSELHAAFQFIAKPKSPSKAKMMVSPEIAKRSMIFKGSPDRCIQANNKTNVPNLRSTIPPFVDDSKQHTKPIGVSVKGKQVLSPEIQKRSLMFNKAQSERGVYGVSACQSTTSLSPFASPLSAGKKTMQMPSRGGTKASPSPDSTDRRSNKVFNAKVANISNLPVEMQKSPHPTSKPSVVIGGGGKYYSLSDLKERNVEGIDYSQREQYLAPIEFERLFKMSKETFLNLPKWKRDKAKRAIGLF